MQLTSADTADIQVTIDIFKKQLEEENDNLYKLKKNMALKLAYNSFDDSKYIEGTR